MTLEKISQLIHALNDQDIIYCHWKSNFTLSKSLNGDDDLDLLVDLKSLPDAQSILMDLGFKQAYAASSSEPPGIYHYYGFDPQSNKLVHVHLFGRIQTGESFVKNHLLPFELMLFENVSQFEDIKVVSKPTELILFILRTFIKYGSLLDLVYLLGKSEIIQAELKWLKTDKDVKKSLVLLNKYCPAIDDELFLKCIKALEENSSIIKKIMLSLIVRRRLRIYTLYNPITQAIKTLNFIWSRGRRRIVGKKKDKMRRSGGAVIAFVGPEATGKSTLVLETRDLLKQAFSVKTIHAGKPPTSWVSAPLNMILPLGRKILPQLRSVQKKGIMSGPSKKQDNSKNSGFTGVIYALRAASLAWDRRNLLIKARRLAAKSEIVISDRYPSNEVGGMDGPRLQIKSNPEGLFSLIYNWLAKLEEKFYQEVPPPDIVLKLKVSVDTAKVRNRERIKAGKETDEYIEIRHSQIRDWGMAGTKYIFTIDTEKSLQETILNVKENIWEVI